MKIDKSYLIARMKEPSTRRSLGIAFGIVGINVDSDAIVAIGMGISAIIGIFVPDNISK